MATSRPAQPRWAPGTPPAERTAWRWAVDHLPDDALVLPQVAMTVGAGGRTDEAEADLVIVDPSFGVVVVEVKGGTLWYDPEHAAWRRSERDDGFVRDPVRQAKRARSILRDALDRAAVDVRHLALRWAVCVPEAVVEAPGAPVLDEAQLWDARCRTDPAVAYRRTCGDRDARERAPGRTLAETIADTLRGRRTPHPPALRTHVAQHEEYIRIHTESHRNVLHHFSDNPRVLVRGAAGTGKTNLAVHAAARLAALGERVLLACWNIMLAGTLRRAVHAELRAMQSPRAAQVTAAGDGAVVVGHVAGLARQGRPAIPADADTTFFQQTLPDALTTELTDGRFDAIVLDEAQDLSDAWMLALDRLLAPHGRWFAFADRHQDLFASRAALPDFLDLTHELRENFRNSRRIAEFASQFGIAELDCINPEGPPIRFVAAPWDRVVRRSERALRRLQATETLPNADVALLWLFHNPMRGRNDELAARAAAGHVVRTNAATFKGVERPVIVLGLDMDPGKADRRRAEVARAIYVAATRARSHLTVIGDPDVADAYEFAGLATALRRASVR